MFANRKDDKENLQNRIYTKSFRGNGTRSLKTMGALRKALR